MEGRKFIETIRLENILSYGLGNEPFPLEPLNVLIGPNASGKSNLIEALSLLAAAPMDLQAPIRMGGGIRDWLWKGSPTMPTATVDVTLRPPGRPYSGIALRYRLSFTESSGRFRLVDEAIESERPMTPGEARPYYYYRFEEGRPVINVLTTTEDNRIERSLRHEDVSLDRSILSQRRDPDSYPELTFLARRFEEISFYREWNLGRDTPSRRPQQADLQQDRLLEDGSNLSLVLSDLLNHLPTRDRILERMRDFYPSVKNVNTTVLGGMVQLFFEEEELRHTVPATRLSDGSLRYLCLLAVLCHPNPPGVVCIEEPELGLHPDVIPEVAKLLVEASSRSQIFVTTHSDILVDALTDTPEAVVVCEKVAGATQLSRLDAETLKPWLENYRLGELWTSGELGGNRW